MGSAPKPYILPLSLGRYRKICPIKTVLYQLISYSFPVSSRHFRFNQYFLNQCMD